MTGKIYLVAKEALRVGKLVAIVEGYNHVTWEEGKKGSVPFKLEIPNTAAVPRIDSVGMSPIRPFNTFSRAQYTEDVKLFEERILIRSFSKPIANGRYSFDFSYVVPEFLPSSFSLEGCKGDLTWEDIKMKEAAVSTN